MLLIRNTISILTGSVVANSKNGKKGSRGKKDRMTEAEEDAQLLKSAQSKRRIIRVDKHPSNLAPLCKMHPYQLEGLNWLIKLHDHGINGILADEVSVSFFGMVLLWDLVACMQNLNRLFSNYRWAWVRRCRPSRYWPTSGRVVVFGDPTL